MQDRFDKIIEFVLQNEGGYVFDPLDMGGETNYGISKRSYPNVDIKNLTKSQAKAIYKKDFWDKYPFSKIDDVELCKKFFDATVNMGYKQAALLLQRAVGVKDDGIIGPISLKAINDANPVELLSKFRATMSDFYKKLVEIRPKNARFLNGWLRRAYL